eukprot:3398212-Amphidinium_carterae.1
MEKCNPSTIPGSKKPPIAGQPVDKEQHSMCRTSVGQLQLSCFGWVTPAGCHFDNSPQLSAPKQWHGRAMRGTDENGRET